MTEGELNRAYFEWMYQLVYTGREHRGLSFRELFASLHNIEFKYIIDMDLNRYQDGIDLRYRFGYATGISNILIKRYLDKRPCSVLEMIVALAIRCEEHIMANDEIGDRTGYWVQLMLRNLGLSRSDDLRFDERHVEDVISIFLDRNYASDGTGSLFKIENTTQDLRKIEIWYQMYNYLEKFV